MNGDRETKAVFITQDKSLMIILPYMQNLRIVMCHNALKRRIDVFRSNSKKLYKVV